MSEVEVPFENAGDQATLLLAAADDLGLDPAVVRTGTGVFYVPEDVADKAGFGEKKPAAKKTAKKSE
jgi:hypothetical protein